MDLITCMSAAHVRSWPEEWSALYDSMEADGTLDSAAAVDPDALDELDRRYHIYGEIPDVIRSGGAAISKDPALLRWANLTAAALKDREKWYAQSRYVSLPEGAGQAHRMAPLYPFLTMVPDIAAELHRRDVPQSIIDDECSSFAMCVSLAKLRYGEYGMIPVYFSWCQRYVDTRILTIPPLRFERAKMRSAVLLQSVHGESVVLPADVRMHREGMVLGSAGYADEAGSYTATFEESDGAYYGYPCDEKGFCTGVRTEYRKDSWSAVVRPGEEVLSIHIPRGAKLGGSNCADSYKASLEIHGRCYPEFRPKAFVCHSWLMDKRLDEIAGGTPNIANFQKDFHTFPLLSDGREVFNFVFLHEYPNLQDLPENTRMMRALKARYLAGDFVHAFGGVFAIRG